ncbi:hypothetical protein SLE2022_119920 [Rubroshorea leprosula]
MGTTLCPWKNAVIIKLLGKSVNFHVRHSRLLKEWRVENEFEIIDVGLGYYIVKFCSPQDCSMVLTGGPYKLFDHYLAVQPWEPGFHPARAKAPKTAVWVKLHGVPIVCFYEAKLTNQLTLILQPFLQLEGNLPEFVWRLISVNRYHLWILIKRVYLNPSSQLSLKAYTKFAFIVESLATQEHCKYKLQI